MTVGILGGGQLGRMLALAGHRLGMHFLFLEPADNPPAAAVGDVIQAPYDDAAALEELAQRCDVVTYEFENVPVDAVRVIEGLGTVRPCSAALEVAQDRVKEKRGLQKVGIETADFEPVAGPEDVARALDLLGAPIVLKARRMGYDGKGQSVVRSVVDAQRAWDATGGMPAIAEAFVPFDRELSLVAVRAANGDIAFYPLVENHHEAGILRTTVAPAPDLSDELTNRARQYVGALAESVDYVGALGLELFQVGQNLLANEFAPRVHNSGHWTQDGTVTCQFENHLRAVCGLPLGSTELRGTGTVMTNLIGTMAGVSELLSLPEARVHLYDKAPRPGRKLGHVNVVSSETGATTHP